MPDKHKFFSNLSEFEMADLLLTDKTDLLSKEIYQNTLSLTLFTEEAKLVSIEEILESLAKIKSAIRKQLFNSSLNVEMNYHLWFNELEGQLIICVINANHQKLPLEGNMRFVESEHEVIYRFLSSPYLDGLLLGEENKEPSLLDLPDNEFHIWIYKERIGK